MRLRISAVRKLAASTKIQWFASFRGRPAALAAAAGALAVLAVAVVPRLQAQTGAPGGIASGLITWQKANDGVSTAASWQDSSGSGNHAAQPTAASRPVLAAGSAAGGINFNPAFDFDGANDFFSYSSTLGIGGTADSSTIVVFRGDAATHHVHLGDATTGPNQFAVSWNAGPYGVDAGGGPPNCNVGTTTSIGVGQPGIGSLVRASSNATVQLNAGGTGTGTCTNSFTTQNRRLGARNGNYTNGAIAELIQYNRALSATELANVQSYLALKYGITLSQTTPTNYTDSTGATIWDATANATYNKNIAGIGRDDGSALTQKQSRSVNTASSGNLVTIGHVTIAADNAANTNNFPASGSFLIWGDDNGALTQTTVVTGGPVDVTRLTRVWKVQETGTIGGVQVRIPASAVRGVQPTLIRGTSATFATGNTFEPMTANGASYEATIDFANGDFFTFASVPADPGGVAGATLWLRADQSLTTASGSVTQWRDVAGGDLFVQDGAVALPQYIAQSANFNFNPNLNFNVAGQAMRLRSNTVGDLISTTTFDNFSMFAAVTKVTDNQRTFQTRNTAGNFYSLDQNVGGRGGAQIEYTAATVIPNGPALVGVTYAGTAGSARGYVDGRATVDSALTTTTTTLTNGVAVVGAGYGVAEYTGQLGEIVVFPRQLTAAEAQRLNWYLAIKYGRTLDQTAATNYLDSTAAVIWNATTNATYKNNIAGIGRDDASALNQKQSRSVNTTNNGNLVTIGLGTIAGDNASNPNTFAANRNFLIWGDDGATLGQNTFVTGATPAGLRRFVRTWKVQETGTIGPVIVRIPAAVLPGYLAGAHSQRRRELHQHRHLRAAHAERREL